MNNFQVYLNLDVKFSSSYVDIQCDTIAQIDLTSILIDGKITVNFNNEILSVSRLI